MKKSWKLHVLCRSLPQKRLWLQPDYLVFGDAIGRYNQSYCLGRSPSVKPFIMSYCKPYLSILCAYPGNTKGESITVLFDWFGLVCFENKNKNCQLSYSWFQNSQTRGQWYSDTSPFSLPWRIPSISLWRILEQPLITVAGTEVFAATFAYLHTWTLILSPNGATTQNKGFDYDHRPVACTLNIWRS